MWAMLSFILECGISTTGSCTRLALRMRVNMSEIVSVINLPAGFRDAGNQTVHCALAKGHTGTIKFAKVTVTASAHRATIHHPGGTGVAWQLGQAGVIALGFQLRPYCGVLLDGVRLLLVALQP